MTTVAARASIEARAMYWLKARARLWTTIRGRPNRTEAVAASLLCVGLVLLVWHIATAGDTAEERLVSPMILPSIPEAWRSLPSLWFERALARSALWSLARVMGGFVLGIAVGVPLGVVAAAFRRLYAFCNPLSIFGRNVPIAALVPLTMLWFGVGETQKVVFIFLATVAFIFFDAARAVDDVPDSYLDSAYTLGARFVPQYGAIWAAIAGVVYAICFVLGRSALAAVSGEPQLSLAGLIGTGGTAFAIGFLLWFPIASFQVVRKVLFALALPSIVNSLRLLFGLAFGYIMLAEMINSQYGLGSIIETSRRRGPSEHIYMVLVLIALLAFAIDRLILLAQRRLFPYRRAEGR